MNLLRRMNVRLLRRAAERGGVEAMACLGVELMGDKKDEEGLRWLRRAADAGDANAQVQLGSFYDSRNEYEDAVHWYRMAAEQGDATGQHTLGAMYMLGTGVPKDISEGINWYRKAAEAGDTRTQILLGSIYANSEFVPTDVAQAAYWYSAAFKASSLTHELAKKYPDELRWFLSVADESDDPGILLNVANIYSTKGGGVPQDHTEAVRFYHLAADYGSEDALFFLGSRYETATGVAQDYEAAMYWYKLAAEKGHAAAMFNIAMMYNRSEGVPPDSKELYFWFSLCSTVDLPKDQADHARKAIEILNVKLAPESLTEIRERTRQWITTHPPIHFES